MKSHWVWSAAAAVVGFGSVAAAIQEYKSGIVWPEPKPVTPGETAAQPPTDAVVLFDGKTLDAWTNGANWELIDGCAVSKKSDIATKNKFGDCQFHLEFATPEIATGSGQGRGNSGIYFMGRYEVQILDSFDNKTYFDGQCGSIYKQSPPLVNACRKPGEWQTYDIVFEAPKFGSDGKVTKPAFLTVLHNGILVQNHFELKGTTFYDQPASYAKHEERLPINLQFHGNAVKFRNIWLREIPPMIGEAPPK